MYMLTKSPRYVRFYNGIMSCRNMYTGKIYKMEGFSKE